MKKLIFALLLIASISQGADYAEKAWYWCQQNGHTNVDASLSQALNMTGKKGALSYICWSADSWKIANPPSKATLDALDDATVDAWVKAQNAKAEGTAIYDGDTGKLIQAVLVMLKQKNPALELPSKAEVIAKYEQIKAAE